MRTSRTRSFRALLGLLLGSVLMAASQAYAVGDLNLELIADPAGPYDRGQEIWVTVKLNTALVAADSISGYFIDILNSNAAVLEYVGTIRGAAPTCGVNNMAFPGWDEPFVNAITTPNTIRLAASGDPDITGQGCFRRLKYKIKSDAPLGQCSTLSISYAMFNKTTVGGTRTPVQCCVKSVSFSGVINYWKSCPSSFVPIPCVNVALYPGTTCSGTPLDTDVSGNSCTSTAGNFAVVGEAGVDATLCFSRTNVNDDFKSGLADVAAAINASDAVDILKYLVNLDALDTCRLPNDSNYCPPSASPFDRYPAKVAADVDGDGQITPFDSGLIRKVAACITLGGSNPINCIPAQFKKDWRFYCQSKTYANPQPPDKTYSPYAVLPGDVNGNYSNTALYGKTRADVALAVPPVFTTGRDVLVPIELRGNPGGASALQARVGFDPAVLRFVGAVSGDAVEDLHVETLEGSDAVAVIAYSLNGLDAAGTMAVLHFERLTPDGQAVTSPIGLTNAVVGDDMVTALGGVFSTVPGDLQPSTWSQVKRLFKD